MVRETARASSGGLKPRTVRPHTETRVRRAAIWAMVYTEWPAFRDVLSVMAETDGDPKAARAAA